jgi:hypothetical protein
LFFKDGDYEAFERVLAEALKHVPGMRLLCYTLMPNHWHLVIWPRGDGELSDFGHWLTLTHTQRWHAHYHDVGSGHLYQGRFKSFPDTFSPFWYYFAVQEFLIKGTPMALEELTAIVSPPRKPVELCDAVRWELAQTSTGLIFPDDYREYAFAFGSGSFRDESIEVVVFNPCAALYGLRIRELCGYLAELERGDPGRYVPFQIFPNRPGLFPWGWDVNGNDLFWLTKGTPNEWPVVVRAEGYDFQEINLPMTSFLAKSMKQEIECILWNEDGFFPDPERIVFKPCELSLWTRQSPVCAEL